MLNVEILLGHMYLNPSFITREGNTVQQ